MTNLLYSTKIMIRKVFHYTAQKVEDMFLMYQNIAKGLHNFF